jgi:hypothetical protein
VPKSAGYLLVAAGLLVIGVVLGAARSIWLAPPLMRLTPFIYLLLSLLWLPPGLYGLWLLLPQRRGLFGLLLVPLLIGQCCLSLILGAEELGYVGIYGGPHPVLGGHFSCEDTTPQSLICELCIVSSDNPAEIQRVYSFKRLAPLPLLSLTGIDEKSSDRWSTPPCSGL